MISANAVIRTVSHFTVKRVSQSHVLTCQPTWKTSDGIICWHNRYSKGDHGLCLNQIMIRQTTPGTSRESDRHYDFSGQPTRRQFSGSVAGLGLFAKPATAGPIKAPIKAMAFDAFAIFDPSPIFELTEKLFPGKGAVLANLWRARQFEYAWLRTITQQYADFWQVTEDALVFAAQTLRLDLTSEKRVQLMSSYLSIRGWADAGAALRSLKNSGIRLALLSNLTAQMLKAGIGNAGLEEVFEHVLSADRVRTYKPDGRAYQMGVDAFQLQRGEILFAAFAGWDAAGAKRFGYPTFWVNRENRPSEQLGTTADAVGVGLNDLVHYVLG